MFSNSALKKLILPLFFDQVLLITVSVISVLLLSYAGEAAFSGVSLVDMINMLMINVLAALATGGAVVISQYIGLKDSKNALLAANQLITITGVLSFGIALSVWLFSAPILRLLFGTVDADVMKTASIYFIVSGFSYPFLALYNSGAAIFRSMGNSKVPMLVSLLMNLSNLAGNALVIFVLKGGVMGVALSTLTARLLAAVLMLVLTTNQNNPIHIKMKDIFSWHGDMIQRILKIAIPNGIENGITQLGRVLLVSIIALFGTTQIAANGITNSLVLLAVSFGQAMNLAIVPVVGQCVGANDFDQAQSYIKRLLKWTYAVTLGMSLALTLVLPWILNLYSVSAETRSYAYTLIMIHNGLAIFLWPSSFTLPNALRAAGDAKYTMVISIGAMFVFRIFFAYILGVVFQLGVIGVWLAMGVDWSFRTLMFTVRFRKGTWKNFRVV